MFSARPPRVPESSDLRATRPSRTLFVDANTQGIIDVPQHTLWEVNQHTLAPGNTEFLDDVFLCFNFRRDSIQALFLGTGSRFKGKGGVVTSICLQIPLHLHPTLPVLNCQSTRRLWLTTTTGTGTIPLP